MKVQRIGLLVLSLFLCACNRDEFDSLLKQGNTNNNNFDNAIKCDESRLIKNRFIVNWKNGKTTVETSENLELFKKKFLTRHFSDIKSAEYDVTIQAHNTQVTPTLIDMQSWGQNITEAQSAWNQGIAGQGVKVAVIDAAIDYRHPQISPRLDKNAVELSGQSSVDDDRNGLVDDVYGWDFYQNIPDPKNLVSPQNSHGTHVAGVILADHTTGSMRGVAPKAQLIPANFMSNTGMGSLGAAIQALKYVTARGAKVINASWGGPGCSNTLRETMLSLAASNVLIVVASGNDGLDLDQFHDFPTSFNLPNQINVGATNKNDYLTTWSNSSYTFVHLAAPGEDIYSTVNGGYHYMSGTSMAAPFVSGAAALLWSTRPQATYLEIKEALMNSVDIRNLKVSTQGRLNIRKAVEEIKRLVP